MSHTAPRKLHTSIYCRDPVREDFASRWHGSSMAMRGPTACPCRVRMDRARWGRCVEGDDLVWRRDETIVLWEHCVSSRGLQRRRRTARVRMGAHDAARLVSAVSLRGCRRIEDVGSRVQRGDCARCARARDAHETRRRRSRQGARVWRATSRDAPRGSRSRTPAALWRL